MLLVGIHIVISKVLHQGDRLSTGALVFRYAQEKLLVFSILLDYRHLLDSSANSTCISAQNRQLLRTTIIKGKLKDVKLSQVLLCLAGSCGLKVWVSSSLPRLLGFVPGSYASGCGLTVWLSANIATLLFRSQKRRIPEQIPKVWASSSLPRLSVRRIRPSTAKSEGA